MAELIRDPIWQFIITVFVTIVAVLTPILLYLKQRKNKQLSYEIISSTPLISARREYKDKLNIFFEKKLVEQVHLLVIKLFNSGNLPILTDDYERHISLNFGEKAQTLTAEIINTDPKSLESSVGMLINGKGKEVTLSPVMLNDGDSITLKMLVNKFGGEVVVDGRIVGVKEIMQSKGMSSWKLFCIMTFGMIIMTGGVLCGVLLKESPFQWIAYVLIFSGLAMYISGPIMSRKLRKKLLRLTSVRIREG